MWVPRDQHSLGSLPPAKSVEKRAWVRGWLAMPLNSDYNLEVFIYRNGIIISVLLYNAAYCAKIYRISITFLKQFLQVDSPVVPSLNYNKVFGSCSFDGAALLRNLKNNVEVS